MGGLQNWMGPATGQREAPADGRQSARRTDSTLRWRRAARGICLVEMARWRCYCNHAVDRRCELRAATRVEPFAGGSHRAVPQGRRQRRASESLLAACQTHPRHPPSHEHAGSDTGPTPSAATKLEAAPGCRSDVRRAAVAGDTTPPPAVARQPSLARPAAQRAPQILSAVSLGVCTTASENRPLAFRPTSLQVIVCRLPPGSHAA